MKWFLLLTLVLFMAVWNAAWIGYHLLFLALHGEALIVERNSVIAWGEVGFTALTIVISIIVWRKFIREGWLKR